MKHIAIILGILLGSTFIAQCFLGKPNIDTLSISMCWINIYSLLVKNEELKEKIKNGDEK
jgi:hypothetical protein